MKLLARLGGVVLLVLVPACGSSTSQSVPIVDAGGTSEGGTGGGGTGGTGGSSGDAAAGGTGGADAGRLDGADHADVGPGDAAVESDAADDAGIGVEASLPDPNAFACLPAGEEKLSLLVSGGGKVLLDVETPADLSCESRYEPASGSDTALLDLVWSSPTTTLSIAVRASDVMPTQTGTFVPFAVLLSNSTDHWIGAQGKCRLTVAASTKIGQEAFGATQVRESYKVAGKVACDAWFPDAPGQTLDRFDFATRATFLRPR